MYNMVCFIKPSCIVHDRLRLFTPSASTERVAQEDDLIPLKTPVLAADGKTVLNSIRVRKGQVSQTQHGNPSLFSPNYVS
jgi:hypothetical protein